MALRVTSNSSAVGPALAYWLTSFRTSVRAWAVASERMPELKEKVPVYLSPENPLRAP